MAQVASDTLEFFLMDLPVPLEILVEAEFVIGWDSPMHSSNIF